MNFQVFIHVLCHYEVQESEGYIMVCISKAHIGIRDGNNLGCCYTNLVKKKLPLPIPTYGKYPRKGLAKGLANAIRLLDRCTGFVALCQLTKVLQLV